MPAYTEDCVVIRVHVFTCFLRSQTIPHQSRDQVGRRIHHETHLGIFEEWLDHPSTDKRAPTTRPSRGDILYAFFRGWITRGQRDNMSYTWLDPRCGHDIEETADKNTWVQCGVANDFRAAKIMTAVMVLIVLLMVYFSTTGMPQYIAAGISAGLILLTSFAWYNAYISEWKHGFAWDRFEYEIGGLQRNGMSRQEAIAAYRMEREKAADRATAMAAANRQAASTASIAGAIFNGFRSR